MVPTAGDEDRLEAFGPEVCRRLLRRHRFGRIAVTDADGPVIFPVNYMMDGDSIVFRTDEGTKLHSARAGATVAFEIDGVDPVHRLGWSVLARGVLEPVAATDASSERAVLPAAPYPEGRRTHVVRISSPHLTGRRIPVSRDIAEAWLDQAEIGNVWYDRDGSDLLG